MPDFYLIGSLPWWLVALIGLGAASLLVQQYFSLKQRLTLTQSSLVVALRAIVYAILIFFLLGPALVEKSVTQLRRPLTLLIDSSQSMALPARSDFAADGKTVKSRLDVVRETLTGGKESVIQKLSRDYDLRVYRLGAGLEPIAPASVAELKAQDPGSRLLESLQSAAKEGGASSGILLFTDGITNGEIQSLENKLAVPVFAVGVGESEGFTDLRIADLRAPEFAFRRREFKLDLMVQAFGLKGKTVPLYFNRGKNLITTRSVVIDADPFEQQITLGFTPNEIGTHGFSLTIPAQPGEQITHNNHREFKVDVQRDKIRVLTLTGSPAWNYRFLRMAMKQDPLIELVSFVFLRTPTDSVDVPDNQLSLIPFPIDDIFLEELHNFDVVFFDNFSHRAYFNPVYLEKVRDFIRDGGGFAMLGGARAFDSGGYHESALKEALPVELDGKGDYQFSVSSTAALTASGRAHPVTRLLPEPKSNEEAWAKMPVLTGINLVRGAKGETLITSGGRGIGAGAPLLTVGRFGKGRTLALMTDDAWRWNFIAVGNRETPQHHLKFVRQAVRWLAQEPSFEQVQIRPIPLARPGEKIPIRLRVLKDDFTPAPQAAVQLRVVGPEGEPSLISVAADSEEGIFIGEYTPVREGAHRVEAEATLLGKVLGKDRTSFSVAVTYEETNDGRPRPDLLRKIARDSQGEFLMVGDWNEKTLQTIAAKLESHSPSQIIAQRQTRLWNNLWPFFVILLLLGSEWWLRRKWGLI